MPQLNPAPWLFIMLLSWLTYSFVLQPKILLFIDANPPSSKASSPATTTPWNWPWT